MRLPNTIAAAVDVVDGSLAPPPLLLFLDIRADCVGAILPEVEKPEMASKFPKESREEDVGYIRMHFKLEWPREKIADEAIQSYIFCLSLHDRPLSAFLQI